MYEWFEEAVLQVCLGVEAAGVATIVIGSAAAMARLGWTAVRAATPFSQAYATCRLAIGRALLLGLELLIAADIIRTVATSPTFTSVGVLATIIAIRTFLSLSLQLEIEGRLPWQTRGDAAAGASLSAPPSPAGDLCPSSRT